MRLAEQTDDYVAGSPSASAAVQRRIHEGMPYKLAKSTVLTRGGTSNETDENTPRRTCANERRGRDGVRRRNQNGLAYLYSLNRSCSRVSCSYCPPPPSSLFPPVTLNTDKILLDSIEIKI